MKVSPWGRVGKTKARKKEEREKEEEEREKESERKRVREGGSRAEKLKDCQEELLLDKQKKYSGG